MIKRIKTKNFRNLKDINLKVSKNLIITGPNGSGKTAILESVLLCLTTKSFRSKEIEAINFDNEFFRLESEVEISSNIDTISLYVDKQKKELLVNKKRTPAINLIGLFPVVLFEPNLFSDFINTSTSRRKYIDTILINDTNYRQAFFKHGSLLRQRNSFLNQNKKINKVDHALLEILTIQLIENYRIIQNLRASFINELNREIEDIYFQIAGVRSNIVLEYHPSIKVESLSFSDLKTIGTIDRERIVGFSLFGAHRDDLKIIFNGSQIKDTASRGEIRSVVLALKLLETRIVFAKTNKEVTLFLDDVFGELDISHQQHLIGEIASHNTILTSTNLERAIDLSDKQLIELIDGEIVNG